MRSLRRLLAGILIATAALLLPMAGISAAVSLGECVNAGGRLGVGNGYFYCNNPGGLYDGMVID